LISGNKYLTLLGSFGELDNWKNRNLSENYKAFPIHDEHMLDKFPMLSAVFDQIGLNLSHLKHTDKSILIKDCHRQYGVFCVENAEGSNLIPKQAEFVRPYSVKSVFGFGGIYSTSNVYAVIIFSRERLSRKDAQLFLSLNPAIKQITLAHEITGNIFKTDRKDTNALVDGICDEIPTVQIKSQNKTISRQHKDIIEKEMVLNSSIELQMTNEYLLGMSEELKESHEKFRSLVENTTDWIWEVNEHNRYTYASPQVRELLGYEPDEIIGTTPFDLMTPEDQQRVRKLFVEAAGRQEPFFRLENANLHRDGHTVILETSGVPIFGSDGSFKGYRGIDRDITERKQAENALRRSEKSLAEAQRIAHLGNWDWNIVDNELHWSDEVYRIFGLKPQEFDATYAAFLISVHPDDKEFVKNTVNKALHERLPYSTNHRIVLPSGTVRIVREEAEVTYDEDGKPVRMIGTVQDVTEIRKMEEALLQSEKLRSIGTITAGISHEFNNILAIISGNVQLLGRTYKDHGDLTDALRIIKRATDDGAEISSKMLEFTKTSQDTKKLVSSDIRDLIRQSIDFTMPRWKNEAQARGITYKMDTEGMKNVSSILCNPTELREVFINLIINALDAMPEGGSLSFSTWSGDDTVFVSISDTGEGMSEEVRKNIFDPFFTTKSPVGTGLGMSMAYGIITRHGGKIEAESELGKGTIFSLQIPIAAKEGDTELFSEPVQDIQCKSLHILVVDDEVNIGKLLDEFLSDDGHKVKTVDNGADAIKLSKRKNFDLVLCDLVMPYVSGYDVIKALNKLDRRPKIGIITGWNEKLKPIEEGMNVDFVVRKPFDFSELANHINEAFGTDSR
jgi:PAS domain S-box-containing protein